MSAGLEGRVQFLKGVGPARAKDFANLGVTTIGDLLFTFPRDISDRSNIIPIEDAEDGEEVVVCATPIDSKQVNVRRRKMTIITVRFEDDTGTLDAVWFNSPWVLDKFAGQPVLLYGKIKRDGNNRKMEHPSFELVGEGQKNR